MAYQGLFERQSLADLAVPSDQFSPAGLEFWGQISFLKAGLVFADRATTVSPTYAREVRRAPVGEGMEGVIRARFPDGGRDDLVGIVNGIDDEVWDPARDSLLERKYSAVTLADKDENKRALGALGLAVDPRRPVIGIVSRLVEQKGIDVVLAALPAILRTGAQLVILGAGDSALENDILAAAAAHPADMAVRIGYSESLAHRIIAGADMILMPSRFEPCGLTQLYGQRYGSLPIVHKVGGLADTVHDLQDGFAFADLTPAGVALAVTRAVSVHRDPRAWRAMQERAMAKNMGWDSCASRYTALYADLIATGEKRNHGTSHRAYS
jgi:starch synthase